MSDSLIGVRPCGCVTAWCSRDCTPEDIRAFYREMADSGRGVEITDLETAKHLLGKCEHITIEVAA